MISLTLVIVIFTCIFSYQGFNDNRLKNKFLFHPASVNEFGQWYRFLTSGFLHNDGWHLGINMFVLYQFGENLERFCMGQFGDLKGRGIYLLVYLGAIIVGSLPLYIKHKNNQYYSALGASGGVSGILFASIFIWPWAMLGFMLIIPMPYVVFGVVYMFYESYMGKRGRGNIAHDAHIWGAIFGYISISIILFLLKPELAQFLVERLLSGPDF